MITFTDQKLHACSYSEACTMEKIKETKIFTKRLFSCNKKLETEVKENL